VIMSMIGFYIISVKPWILLPQIWFVAWLVILFATTSQCGPAPPGFRVCWYLSVDSIKEGSAHRKIYTCIRQHKQKKSTHPWPDGFRIHDPCLIACLKLV
jgi:hypothetical protein